MYNGGRFPVTVHSKVFKLPLFEEKVSFLDDIHGYCCICLKEKQRRRKRIFFVTTGNCLSELNYKLYVILTTVIVANIPTFPEYSRLFIMT